MSECDLKQYREDFVLSSCLVVALLPNYDAGLKIASPRHIYFLGFELISTPNV